MNQLEKIAVSSLLHDVLHIMQQLDMENEIPRLIPSSWTELDSLLNFVSRTHLQSDLSTAAMNEERILSELISEAENISVAKTIDSKGTVSPMKSIFFGMHRPDENISDRFFHASELSDSILLELKRSKKEIFFSPSYLINSFLDDLEKSARHIQHACVDTLYYIIRKYFWSISLAHHGDEFMFSYFDHAKITAAFACCLYQYLQHHHKNIFISQNSRVVRDTIQDASETRYCILKLSINDLQVNINPIHKLTERSITLSACKDILSLYGLYDFCILHSTTSTAVLLIPNLYQEKLQELLLRSNKRLLSEYGFEFTLNHQLEPVRKSDVVKHFSSHRNTGDLFFRDIDLDKPCTQSDFQFLKDNYDSIFEPVKTNEETSASQPPEIYLKKCAHPALTFPIHNKTDETPLFCRWDIADKNFQKIFPDHPAITYQLTAAGNFMHNITTFPKKHERGFLLDTYNTEHTQLSYPIVILRLTAYNPTAHLPIYLDLSHLNAYLSLSEIILQAGIGLYLHKRPETTVYWACANELCFHVPIEYIHKTLKKIFELATDQITDNRVISLNAFLLFDGSISYKTAKQPIPAHGNELNLFDTRISLEKAFALFEKGNELLELYDSAKPHIRKQFIDCIQYIKVYGTIPVRTTNTAIGMDDVSDYFLSYSDPLLLAYWMSPLLTKEH
ncbi:MAG: hypothetical protein RBU23_06915 [Candidatus Auribacterota bacterium]|jgi:hypothetical protein|nr:hypothetical protein [Candidatus Auribacterota bacterium]